MDFYVYIHRRKTDGQIFYVGKGQGQRAWDTISRNKFWHSVAKKHGWVVELFAQGLQEWYALELEQNLIALHGRKDLHRGPLTNMTDGGDGGTFGAIISNEHKEAIRKAHKGKVLSHQTKEKISISLFGRYKGGKNPNAKNVCVLFLSGNSQNFSSCSEAAEFFGVSKSAVKAWIHFRRKIPEKFQIKEISYGDTLSSTSNNTPCADTICAKSVGDIG